MRRFSAVAGLALAAAVVSAAPALAGAAEQTQTRAQVRTSGSDRPVLVCGTDAATRRAFTRDHGAPPVFITAREALALQSSDPSWTTPRCMTAREHALYKDAATTFARAR